MRLHDVEFWRMTPRKLGYMLERAAYLRQLSDLQAGMICSVLANIASGFGGGTRTFTPADFVPGLKREVQRQDPRAQFEILRALAIATTGLDPAEA